MPSFICPALEPIVTVPWVNEWKKCLFSCRIFHLNSQFFKLWDKTWDDQEYASAGIWKGIYWEKNKTISHGNSIDKGSRHWRCLTGPNSGALNLINKYLSSQSSELQADIHHGSVDLLFFLSDTEISMSIPHSSLRLSP